MRMLAMAVMMGCALATPLAAQEGEPLPVRGSAVPPPSTEQLACSVSGGTAVSFAALVESPTGQCVTVSGWHEGFTLAADLNTLYRRDRDDNRQSTAAQIGLTNVPATYADSGVRVTGLVRDCAQTPPAPADGLHYCALNAGRYLDVVRWQLVSQPGFVRMPLAGRPAALGNLALMPAGPVADRLAAAAAPLWAAIAANDAGQLANLLESRDAIGAAVIVHQAQPAATRWTMGRPRIVVLGWRLPDDATAAQREGLAARGDVEGVVCATDDATAAANLWPIDTRDTAVHAERPYLCATIWLPDGAAPRRSMRHAEMILPEPRP